MSNEGQQKEERSIGKVLPIEEFLRKPEKFLDGKPFFQAVAPSNGNVPENARGPFKGSNGNPNYVWIIPMTGAFPTHMTGVHSEQNSSGCSVTHPTCLRCIELSSQIQDLGKIPYRTEKSKIKILVGNACAVRVKEGELLQSIMGCIAEVTAEIHPINGSRALPNEIVMGDNPGTESHVVFNSDGNAIKPIRVSRSCCHECGSIKSQVGISALLTQHPRVVVSLEKSNKPAALLEELGGFERSSYRCDPRDNK